jgi:hypothetical protein
MLPGEDVETRDLKISEDDLLVASGLTLNLN